MDLLAKYSPNDEHVIANPYPYYTALRQGPSAHYVEADDLWVVSRFAEINVVAKDPATFSSAAYWSLFNGTLSQHTRFRRDPREYAARQPRHLLALDPPDHVAIRRMAVRTFTRGAVASYQESIRQLCHELIDGMVETAARGGDVDLVKHFNQPLPVRVIAKILGIDDQRLPDLERWSLFLTDRQVGLGDTEDDKCELENMISYFGELIAERRAEPRNDLIDILLRENDAAGTVLSDRDLFNFFTLLLLAGHETTTGLLSNLFNALFKYPEQLRKTWVAEDVEAIVEEALRFESTAQAFPRVAQRAATIGDTEVPEGATLLVLLGSGNRDERRWQQPDVFDIDRESHSNLGFGTGIHHCLGAPLGRLEVKVAIEALRSRLRCITPVAEPTRRATNVLRGFTAMPVSIVEA